MVYAMYLSLPVTLYVWFLRRRVVEVVLKRKFKFVHLAVHQSIASVVSFRYVSAVYLYLLKNSSFEYAVFYFAVGKSSSACNELHQ